jgi:hypothetical protein
VAVAVAIAGTSGISCADVEAATKASKKQLLPSMVERRLASTGTKWVSTKADSE